MLMALKMGKKGNCPSIDYCYHRNVHCETQSEAKAKLYIGRYEAPWEPRGGGPLSTSVEGEFRSDDTGQKGFIKNSSNEQGVNLLVVLFL